MSEIGAKIFDLPPMPLRVKKIGTIYVKKCFRLLTSIGLKVKLIAATTYPERLPKF